MRNFIDMISLMEGSVVSLDQYRKSKSEPAFSLRDTLKGMFDQAAQQYKGAKFLPMAHAFVEKMDPALEPRIHATVEVRDYRPNDAAKQAISELRRAKWAMHRPSTPRNAADRRERIENPNQDANGPYFTREDISFDEALAWFSGRDNREMIASFGNYSPSHGFGTAVGLNWSPDGLQWSLSVSGFDNDSGKFERHVIDDDEDWAEFRQAMAIIRRASMASVKEAISEDEAPASAPNAAMIAEFESLSSPNPLNHRERILDDAVVDMRLGFSGADTVHVQNIRSLRRGGGSKSLKIICDLADKHGVTLDLFAKGYSDVPTDVLVKWYRSYGFVTLDGGVADDEGVFGFDMERNPRRVLKLRGFVKRPH